MLGLRFSAVGKGLTLALLVATSWVGCTYDFDAPFAETPAGGAGGGGGGLGGMGAGGGTGGDGGGIGGTGGVSCANPPPAPTGPTPADGATDIDSSTLSTVGWEDVDGAAGYEVYLSESCPPPAYPNGGFQSVSASELGSLSLSAGVSYCWQVVVLGDVPGCFTAGPVWTFDTAGSCTDPSPGPPTVSSVDATYAPGTTSDTYTLTFSEGVTGIYGHVTWTPVVGNGTMGTLTAVDGSTFTVPFSGVSDSDRYTLTVGPGVSDVCGNPMGTAVDIDILIHNDGGLDCQEPADLYSETYYAGPGNHDCWAIPGDPQDHYDDYNFACDPVTGGDVVIEYTTGPTQNTLNFDAAITNYEPNAYIGLEINDGPCPTGTTLYCEGDGGPGSGTTDSGSVSVNPSSTYFVWVADAFGSHYRPDVDLCLW